MSPFDSSLGITVTTWGTFLTRDGERWTAVPGLAGIEVSEVVFHPHDPTRIYLGTRDHGLLVTTDQGATWSPLPGNLPQGHVIALAVSPLNPNLMYAGLWGRSLFKSTDGGLTWTRIYNGVGLPCPRKILAAPWSSQQVYAVSGHCTDYSMEELEGVFFSSNGGEDWKRLSVSHHLEAKRTSAQDIEPIPEDNALYVATWGMGVIHTGHSTVSLMREPEPMNAVTDLLADPTASRGVLIGAPGGLWRRSTQGLEKLFDRGEVSAIGLSTARPESIWIGNYQGDMWRSLDRGKTWHRVEGMAECPEKLPSGG